MKDKIKQLINTREFHICIIVLIIICILFVVGMVSLKYNVEGETNLPFKLSKVTVISSVEGTDNEDAENKWNLSVNQNNDIYLYIDKNNKYKNTEIIESIVLDNFDIKENIKVGKLKLFKPESSIDSTIFKNTDANCTDRIEYTGSPESSIKNLKVSNQGGLIIFRYAITEIGNYISKEDEQINHNDLLKKININNDDLKCNIDFNITIKLQSGKKYRSTVKLELPIDNVVENGTQSKEKLDLEDVIFKRVNNE